MSYPFPSYSRDASGLYGPTLKGHRYQPISYHSRTARPRRKSNKSRWSIREDHEYEVFRLADEPAPWWYCADSDALFSVVDHGTVQLGLDGERIAKFPRPTNAPDPWHGFPVLSEDSSPGERLLDLWIKTAVIPEHVRRKIEAGKL
jgi:hypothetical protein